MKRITLFCFACSGASAMSYLRWRRLLPDWIDIKPVELPGRGQRIAEPFVKNFTPLVEKLTREIVSELPENYAMFGHSLGGLLAHGCSLRLQQEGKPLPRALFVASCSAPSARNFDFSSLVSDDDLVERLRRLNGTPAEVFENRELLDLTLAVTRADFAVCASHDYTKSDPLPVPIFVSGGRDDDIPEAALVAWEKETAKTFSLDMFSGGHFFLREQEAQFLQMLKAKLQPFECLSN